MVQVDHSLLGGAGEGRRGTYLSRFGTNTGIRVGIQVQDRQGLLLHMMRERCDVAAQHLHNCADLECFAEFHRDCPQARRTAASVVLLPTYPRYSTRDALRNVRVIREHFGRA